MRSTGEEPHQPSSSGRLPALFLTAILALAITVPFLIRLRLLATPFERDEGEYAYAGQLLLDGIPPFAQAFNMKMPGIYAAYAAVMALFGQTVIGVHLGLLLVQGGVLGCVFLLGRRLGGTRCGATAAAFYGILSLSITVLGLFPNAEFWVLLPALAGLTALLAYAEQKRWSTLFLAGILLGTGFILKQHGIAFVACGAVFVVWHSWTSRCRKDEPRGAAPNPAGEGKAIPRPLMTGRDVDAFPSLSANDTQHASVNVAAQPLGGLEGPLPRQQGRGGSATTTSVPNAPGGRWRSSATRSRPAPSVSGSLLTRLGVFLVGALLPFLLVCAWMAYAGVFGRFWFWTFTYAREYVGQVTPLQGLRNLATELGSILTASPLIWGLAALGLVGLPGNRTQRAPQRFFPAMFLLFGFLATCPGLFFRQHYFILLLPAVALLAALGLDTLEQRLSARFNQRLGNFIFLLLLTAACALPLLREQAPFFRLSPPQVSRLAYGGDPFPESEVIATWIRNHTQPDDRIAVIGSEPQLYFLAHRKAATGFIYMYPLMEEQTFARDMQDSFIRDLEKTAPKVLVYVNTTTSWLMRPKSAQRLFEWLDPVLRTYYEPILFADIRAIDRTDYVWGEKASRYAPRGKSWVGVFRLRTPAQAAEPRH